ncbi:choice-of-anchor J domain-containing protein [Wenzhouxiangella sp. EGI_FJ10409]|uniref:choice-of-anchor J domain-containing protein n=1 Tax=Wenzhouxiangella sp. EGI_FJ10409 TaxID=3243767 RepID=UPI0035D7538B
MTRILAAILMAILTTTAVAAGERPPPASWALERDTLADIRQLDTLRYDALDLEAIAAEDAGREAMGQPPRFAIPRETSVRTADAGRWEVDGDTAIWRIAVSAEEAVLLNFGFDDVFLPEGARLYVYSPKAADEQSMAPPGVIGPYGSEINKPHGEFWTPNLRGNEAVIEFNVPVERQDELRFRIKQVSQGYRGFGGTALSYHQNKRQGNYDGKQACETTGGARSGACNQDVACLSEEDPWNDPVRSVGAYTVSGTDTCTGSLVNNTANDQRMLFVTASHCIGESDPPSMVVYWNYEWPTCRRPGDSEGTDTNPPDPNESTSGATWLAATPSPFSGCSTPGECSDVTLTELDGTPDEEWDLHWSGWDRRPPPTACAQGPGDETDGLCASIHHPAVDEKRITFVAEDMESGNIASAQGIHWHPYWHPDPPELPNMPDGGDIPPAVTEPGSSGSPLYSADQRFVGVLSGGPAFCGATGEDLSDFYGGLWHAWDGTGTETTRMKDHLDPVGNEPDFIEGIDGAGFTIAPEETSLSQCGFDDIVLNVDVNQSGDFADPVTLSSTGLPGGVGSGFSTNPVTPPGSTQLTLDSLSQAGTGSFQFDLEGSGGGFDQTVQMSVALSDDTPGAATITAPGDGALGVSTNPTITWDAADQGVDYILEIAEDAAFTQVVYSATVQGTSHQADAGLDTSASYYLRIRASNDCGDGDWSPTVEFTTESLPGDCPSGTQATSLLTEDFDDASLPSGWSTDGSVGSATWVPSTAQTESGSHSVFAENIDSESDQRLASPAVSLPNDATSLFLTFHNWQDIESADPGCYDGGFLEISTDGGGSWSQVTDADIQVRAYDGDIDGGFGNPLGGNPGWCGDPRDAWERYSVDLSNWAGEDVSFRWRFGTDSSISQYGWHVDSVEVKACEAAQPIIFEDRFEGAAAR